MMGVVNIADYRPHITLDTRPLDGTVHVFPVAWLENWIAGRPCERPSDEILRTIIGEWLADLTEEEPTK